MVLTIEINRIQNESYSSRFKRKNTNEVGISTFRLLGHRPHRPRQGVGPQSIEPGRRDVLVSSRAGMIHLPWHGQILIRRLRKGLLGRSR